MALKRVYILSAFGEGSSIAPHLEGLDVVMGQIEDLKDTMLPQEKKKEEDPEEKKRRLSVGDGLVKKISAEKLVKMVNQDPSPEEAFVFTDLNVCWKFAEQMKDSGVPGIYPTKEDRELEVDREKMKEIFAKEYKDLEPSVVEEFKKIEEGIRFLESSEDCWVLKGYDVDAPTVVPDTDDPEKAREQVVAALEANKDKYEKSGYILEKMIQDAIELTPEAIFYDGKMIAASIDIELKRQYAGDIGPMCGCAADLVFPITLDSPILKTAFPKWAMDYAKRHKGLFIFDCSILYDPKTGKGKAGECCSNRFGWNSVLTEMALSGGPVAFLETLGEAKDPFRGSDTFGASVRVFNPHKDGGLAKEGLAIDYGPEDLYLLDAKEEGDKCLTAGYSPDLAVAVGTGNTVRSAAHRAYLALMDLNFEGKTYRPESDYMSRDYASSIPKRFDYGRKKGLFYLP